MNKIEVQPLSIERIGFELEMYEARYGVPSDRLQEVFLQGEPTEDQRRWHMLYLTLQAAVRAAGNTDQP